MLVAQLHTLQITSPFYDFFITNLIFWLSHYLRQILVLVDDIIAKSNRYNFKIGLQLINKLTLWKVDAGSTALIYLQGLWLTLFLDISYMQQFTTNSLSEVLAACSTVWIRRGWQLLNRRKTMNMKNVKKPMIPLLNSLNEQGKEGNIDVYVNLCQWGENWTHHGGSCDVHPCST